MNLYSIFRDSNFLFWMPFLILACTGIGKVQGTAKVNENGDQITFCHFSDDDLLQTIEYYRKDASETFQTHQREYLFWQEAQPVPRLIRRTLENDNGQMILSSSFFYHSEGQLIKEIVAIYRWDLQRYQTDGEKIYEIHLNYNQEGQLISSVDSKGTMAFKCETQHFENVTALQDCISISQAWNKAVTTFYSCVYYLLTSAHQTKIEWKSELKLPTPVAQALERIGKALLGENTYLLMGPYFEKTYVDYYGRHEINDKVRVTFINGIFNTRYTMLQSLDMISDTHGGAKVHYVFRPTEGWTWDLGRAVMIKTAFALFGFRSLHAHLLAQMWRDLIQEMGGIEGGGVIVHYAHSLGGSDTGRARALLTPEEQKMIRVVTFGSATLVRNEGFQSVINHVSVNDGVSSFFLEPLGHIRNFFDPNTNVYFHGSFFNPPHWPTDHFLEGPTYGPILRDLGEKFLIEFTPN